VCAADTLSVREPSSCIHYKTHECSSNLSLCSQLCSSECYSFNVFRSKCTHSTDVKSLVFLVTAVFFLCTCRMNKLALTEGVDTAHNQPLLSVHARNDAAQGLTTITQCCLAFLWLWICRQFLNLDFSRITTQMFTQHETTNSHCW